MSTTLLAPPAEITWWHARTLEAAAAGRIRYDVRQYPIHAVDNNTVQMIWMGLLDDAPGGPVITPLGQSLLDTYRANQPTPTGPALSAPKAGNQPQPVATYEQPDLFTTA